MRTYSCFINSINFNSRFIMKKLLFTLAALMMASSAFAGHWVTFEAEDFDYTSGDIFVMKDGVTLEAYGRIDYDHFRFYANRTMTLTNADGIMKVEFTCISEDDSQYGPGNLDMGENLRGMYTYEGFIGLWEDGQTAPYNEEDYNNGVTPLQSVSFVPDYQVRCTKISVYVLGGDPVTPTEMTAAPVFNGYTTDGIHAYFVEINETEPSTIYYRVFVWDAENGEWVVYGEEDWTEYTEILSFTGDGKYRVEAYAVATDKLPSYDIAYEFTVSPLTGIAEMNADKAISSVRYFNAAGQEMSEANGLTIVVTTYTDGTTNAAKVIK